jgi:MFS family permease
MRLSLKRAPRSGPSPSRPPRGSSELGAARPSLEKRNVLLLAAAQALFQTTSVLTVTISGIVGRGLAPHAGLATLPIAMMVVGAAAMMIPASLLMQRFGRKPGFLLGTLLGVAAGATAAWGVAQGSFFLLVAGNMLVGAYQGFAQYYRFAAGEAAGPEFRSRAISWVIAGGIVAAFAGPNIARYTQAWGAIPFLWSYLSLTVIGLLAMAAISGLRLPAAGAEASQEPARPLARIMAQPAFLTALVGSSVGYGVMIMVMTATPIAMQMCGLPVGDAATVIQWHVVGMFLPSFFTGHLIRRFGVLHIMAAGTACLAGHVVVAISGTEFAQFLSALVLLGIGWNFLFIGGTTLLAETYRPSERAKAQGTHDFLVFAVLTAASFSAGSVLNLSGWNAVNLLVLPLLGLAMLMIVGLGIQRWVQPRSA